MAASKPVTTVCFVCHATGLGTFTHQLDRILPVAVPQSGLAPPYTQRRLGSGRLTTYVYANLSGLELPDRAQRRREDHRICRWHGPPSRSSQPVALESSVPWSFPLSLSLDLRAALPSGTITATATHRAATGERSVQRQWPRLIQRPTLGNGRLSSLRLIDLALASEGGCFWVFHLEPLIRAASAVRRAKPLGQPLFELLQAKYRTILAATNRLFVVPISTPRGYAIGLLSVHLRRRKRQLRPGRATLWPGRPHGAVWRSTRPVDAFQSFHRLRLQRHAS